MRSRLALLLVTGVAGLAGCEPLSITAFGVGASAGVTHSMGGMTYRTFTAPLTRVRGATMTALNRMGIKVDSVSKNGSGEVVIKADASGREIEIQLEPLTPNTTRMRTVARNGWFFDSATATEIILQTEKSMGNV